MTNKLFILGSIILVGIMGFWFINQSKFSTETEELPKIVSADIYKKDNPKEFIGEKGEMIIFTDNQLQIPTSGFETNMVRFFNTELDGKKIYFMIVKDEKGVYRAAANGCEVCFASKKGFRQEGDFIVCNNCGNQFSLDTLGVTKGGCNPGPINPDIPVNNGNLIIKTSELQQVTNLF